MGIDLWPPRCSAPKSQTVYLSPLLQVPGEALNTEVTTLGGI